jgi:putative SOS response-associated peptidase YedK
MCGRYRLARKKEILAETFDVDNDVEWSPRYNVAPGQGVPVLRQDAAEPLRSLSLVRWGLIPPWSKEAKTGYKMVNARAETVASTPAFRDLPISPLLDSCGRLLRMGEGGQAENSFLVLDGR